MPVHVCVEHHTAKGTDNRWEEWNSDRKINDILSDAFASQRNHKCINSSDSRKLLVKPEHQDNYPCVADEKSVESRGILILMINSGVSIPVWDKVTPFWLVTYLIEPWASGAAALTFEVY